MGVMKKKLIEEQIKQELELEIADSKDVRLLRLLMLIMNEKTFHMFMSEKKPRQKMRLNECIDKSQERFV